MGRPGRLHRARLVVALAAGAAAMALAAALSCVPDLPPDRPPPAPPADGGAGAGSRAVCGDGYIDLAAGEECDPGAERADGGACSLNCKVVCSGLKWPGNDHCYELEPAVKALRPSAETVCGNLEGSHVATFASEDELQAAVTYARDNVLAASDFWVGLVDDYARYSSVVPDEPGWSPACAGCYAHTSDPTAPLHLPRGVDAGAGCVVATFLAAQGSTVPPWDQHACSGLLGAHVLCEREPVGNHWRGRDAGIVDIDLVFTAGAKHYVYVSTLLPAAPAQTYCAMLAGSLVVLESRDEREQLWYELSRLTTPPSGVWIGLATDDAGVWTWDDGTRSDAGYPPPWAVGQPASPAGRAFLEYAEYGGPVDNTLAKTASVDSGVETAKPFVCEIRAGDGGP